MSLDGELRSIRINIEKDHPEDRVGRDDSYSPPYSFMLVTDLDGEPITLSPGTYQVEKPTEDELTFGGFFTHRNADDEVTGYHTREHGGTFTITSCPAKNY